MVLVKNESPVLRVQMLGEFSLSWNGQVITDGDNRSRKVWLLLSYLLCCRNRPISQSELFSLLWNEADSANPTNALKTMFHRARAMLDGLGNDAGHTLVVRRNGNYTWNDDIPLVLDTERFETLCQEAAAELDPSQQLEQYQGALALYQGDFLPKLSSEPWVIPQCAYLHNLYLSGVRTVLPLLRERQRLADVILLCSRAIRVEPYDETLYQELMQAQLELGNHQSAIKAFETMSELLYSNFGIMPSDKSKTLYREAIRTVNTQSVDLGLLREQLAEDPEDGGGALSCDYDFFRAIYRAEARAVARNGSAVHIALLSVAGDGRELSRRSLDCCMDNLQSTVALSLRRGDVFARCSISQYVLLLPQANYENSCMVCSRITKTFARKYPHSPAALSYTVQPLLPNL